MAKKEKLSLDEMLEKALVKDEDKPYEVPSNWVWTRIGGVVSDIKNGTTIKQNKDGIGLPVTRIESIQNYKIDFSRVGYIAEVDKVKESDFYIEGNVALSHINSAEHVGKTAIIKKDLLPLVHGMNLLRLTFNKNCNPYFFYFYSQSYYYKQEIINRINMAVNQVSINQKQLKDIPIPLPPIPEQQRIVDTIESFFKKLDRAKELVQNVLDSFEARKSSILRKAFNGELTAKWREENGVDFEREWEENLLGEICEINPKRISTKELDDDIEVSFVPMSSVSDIKGVIEQPLVKKLAEVKKGFTNFSVGDVIFAKITPCMENGKSAVVENLMNGIGFGSTEFHVLRCSERLYNRYLYHLVRWKKFRDEARQVMTGAVGQQRVPKEFLEQYTINTPPVKEQIEIVRILDNLLEKEQKARELCDIIIKNIEQLKKSILARAFRGELNTNNPGEESALELLKEVIQERMES